MLCGCHLEHISLGEMRDRVEVRKNQIDVNVYEILTILSSRWSFNPHKMRSYIKITNYNHIMVQEDKSFTKYKRVKGE